MNAIVEISGKQFKAEKDTKLFVNRLDAKEGDKVTFDNVLLLDNGSKVVVGKPTVKDATVEAKVLKHLKDDKVIVFIGKRETGKSFLVRDLLYYHQNIPIGCIISGTEGANSFYSKIFPSIFIHNEYRPEIIQNFLKRQKLVITQKNEDPPSNKELINFLILVLLFLNLILV